MILSARNAVKRFSPGLRGLSSTISVSNLEVTKTTSPKPKQKNEDLAFGRTFTDHMLEIDWDIENGWHTPKIVPYGDFAISPASSSLHYAVQCFEGMKAYKTASGEIRMFRPDCNMERLQNSMTRLALPKFDEEGFLECMKELIRLDHDWIPQEEGYSLYIRPTAIGNSPYLGLQAPHHAKLFAILSPVGPYFPEGFKPVTLLADTENVRAWPGGVGNAKLGGNYGPTVKPGNDANEKGYAQVLWLFGEQHQVCEIGAMNVFFIIKTKDGKTEVVTPPLSRGDILPGVTRRSILELARNTGDFVVSERAITMGEVRDAWKEGRLMEAFGAGTAAIISPINGIHYQGDDIVVPTGDDIGPISKSFWRMLCDIQYGIVDHPWSVKV